MELEIQIKCNIHIVWGVCAEIYIEDAYGIMDTHKCGRYCTVKKWTNVQKLFLQVWYIYTHEGGSHTGGTKHANIFNIFFSR